MPEKSFDINFFNKLKKPLQKNISLRDYSNFRIGGKADYFFEATTVDELKKAILLARQYSLPYYLIGGGYNILFDDDGYRGLIIRNKAQGVGTRRREEIEALSGTSLRQVLQFLTENGLAGLEFLAGIPGTIGGAVSSNAGAFDKSIGHFLSEAILLDKKGEEIQVRKDYFSFSYRQSQLTEKQAVLLKAVFKVQEGDKKKVQESIEKNLKIRKGKHPSEEVACAGSFFKNPVLSDGKKVSAGFLLDQAGAKDLKVGRAAVYRGHANFIINLDRASAKDVLLLAQELKERVREKFSVELEEEVIFLPAASSMP
ncbi:MAG: UDP-N-acetylmuramate dehydrogenase [Candidatus Aminicenantes bacterium]|nr:UDP-N-acetylmuramate dehydrogenase [Candidatus Aminicenantes bacterium]